MQFKVSESISLRLERARTNIYVQGVLFSQCKSLVIRLPVNRSFDYIEIGSIDEAVEKLQLDDEEQILNKDMYEIPSEIEFWGHCSNIQSWVENNYDTRLLHRNLAFPLLRKLSDLGDPIANTVFKEEIVERFSSGHVTVMIYLIEEGYLKYLNHDEASIIIENINEKVDSKTISKLIEVGLCDLISKDLSYSLISKVLEKGIIHELVKILCDGYIVNLKEDQIRSLILKVIEKSDAGAIEIIMRCKLYNKELESIIVKNLEDPTFQTKFNRSIAILNDPNLLSDLGKRLTSLGLYEIAEKVFDHLIALFPTWGRAWNNIGINYHRLKKYQESIDAYKKAIKFSGDFSEFQKNVVTFYWLNLGHVYIEISDFKKAIKAYNKALKLNPNNFKALGSKGYIYYMKGRYEEAQCYVDSSLKIEPNYINSLELKGLILEAIGKGKI